MRKTNHRKEAKNKSKQIKNEAFYVLFDIYLYQIFFQFSKCKWDSRDGDCDSHCDRHNEFEVH